MEWIVTTPPVAAMFSADDLAYALRLDPDTAAQDAEQSLIAGYLAAAVENAEAATNSSLITRTIMATFWRGDEVHGSTLVLPRGPVAGITSVTDNGTSLDASAYRLTRKGTSDLLTVPNGWQGPLVVVYAAGYGTDPANVPADIRQAIRVHVGTMYEYRESVIDKQLMPVPHSLGDFYERKARTSLAG